MVMGELTQHTDVLVIGAGPAGYAAALRAADLGLEVTLVEDGGRPGGVCLFSGCIPSKVLLYPAVLLGEARRSASMGLHFDPPRIDLAALRAWKERVVDDLARRQLAAIAQRGIQLLRGRAEFESPERIRLQGGEVSRLTFKHCIIAVGSQSARLSGQPEAASARILTAAAALALSQVPADLLVIGAGATGLEIGTIYAALGSRVVLVEQREGLLPEVDRDLIAPLERRLNKVFAEMHFRCRAVALRKSDAGVVVDVEGDGPDPARIYDQVLVAVGRIPNSGGLGLDRTGVRLDAGGFIMVDQRQQTHDAHIYAAGDVTGGMLLAHKAVHQGRVAAEAIASRPAAFDVRAVPAVVYTDPQVAWCGLDETQAQREKRLVRVHRFEWRDSDRAASLGLTDGLTKIVTDPGSGRILGVGVCGRQAEALIAEGVLAVEMGALAEDLALTLHPYPTLSETQSAAARETDSPPQTDN